MNNPRYLNEFDVTMHDDLVSLPLTWKKPRLIFVNSMSDLFHPEVPLSFICRTFETMHKANWHQFQILTKRSERLLELSSSLDWPSNVWMGVSVERQDYTFRIDHLRETGAAIKFLSLEPLLGPLSEMNLDGIDWAIVGGESGPGARPMDEQWVLDVKEQCQSANVPFFFKQWGGTNKKKAGRLLLGRTWDDLPQNSQLSEDS